MKKCFAYPSYYCRSDLSFQVGTLLGYDYTVSSEGLKPYVYRNCCEVVAKTLRARVVELVDTHDLGSCAVRCEGSSPFSSTKFLKVSLINLVCKCVDVMKVWGNMYSLNFFTLDLGPSFRFYHSSPALVQFSQKIAIIYNTFTTKT